MFKQSKQSQKGLTLIELLAVLVIVGIVAAIAIPAIGGVLTGSKNKADESTEKMLVDAAKRYLVDYEMNKADATWLQSTTYAVKTSTMVTDGYLESVPKSQVANKNYLAICMEKVTNNWVLCTADVAANAEPKDEANAALTGGTWGSGTDISKKFYIAN